MAALPFGAGTFDALVSYYAVIHVPRTDHAGVFSEFRRVLRAGGWALVCIGSGDNPDDRDPGSWLGTAMYWSHYDAETTLGLVGGAGFDVADSWDVPDPMDHGTHRFVLARAV
jgi:SAM-dependent methyltransferase